MLYTSTMTESDGTMTIRGCRRWPGPTASQTESRMQTTHDTELTTNSAIRVPVGPSRLTNPSIAAAEGGYMNGNSRPVSGRGGGGGRRRRETSPRTVENWPRAWVPPGWVGRQTPRGPDLQGEPGENPKPARPPEKGPRA